MDRIPFLSELFNILRIYWGEQIFSPANDLVTMPLQGGDILGKLWYPKDHHF